jgi:hypothetical protein
LACVALLVLIPAGASNVCLQYGEHHRAMADQNYLRDVVALGAAGMLERARATTSGTFYGTQEDLSRLTSIAIQTNYRHLDVVNEIGGRKYQLQVHECPVGARYSGDTVYSGSLSVWDRANVGTEMVAEIHSLGALNASGYSLHKTQTGTIADALATIASEGHGQPVVDDARTYRALLEACQTKANEANNAALIRAVLQGVGPKTRDS